MCVSGLPIKSERHAHNISNLALDMMKISKDVRIGDKEITVSRFLFIYSLKTKQSKFYKNFKNYNKTSFSYFNR